MQASNPMSLYYCSLTYVNSKPCSLSHVGGKRKYFLVTCKENSLFEGQVIFIPQSLLKDGFK